MKTRLGAYYGKKKVKFTATFARWSYRLNSHPHGPRKLRTALLRDVRVGDDVVADHVWVREIGLLESVEPAKGEALSFSGRVDSFAKGSYAVDFHIVDIAGIQWAT